MPKREPTTVRVVSVAMADGTDISSPEAQHRLARALLNVPTEPTDIGLKPVQQAKKTA